MVRGTQCAVIAGARAGLRRSAAATAHRAPRTWSISR